MQKGKRAQAAMEYLLTYGWAFLIVVVALGAIYELGLFKSPSQPLCLLPAGFNCLSFTLSDIGVLNVNILQATQSSLNITGYNCTQSSTVIMKRLNPANQVMMSIGSNRTFTMNCYLGNSLALLSPGSYYVGTLAFNYTEGTTGFPHVAIGKIGVTVT